MTEHEAYVAFNMVPGVGAVKLAALNTPTSLSNALSLVGALVFGEFAVQAGIFASELLAYMAFVAIASFTQPSHEFHKIHLPSKPL